MTTPTRSSETLLQRSDKGTLPWLSDILKILLGPGGCPWDQEQTLDSLKMFVLEEVYEVIDAIEEKDTAHHCEELGDLLFQIVFQSEVGHIPMLDIISGIGEKLIRRHPHVFGEVSVKNSQEVISNWERIKQKELSETRHSVLDGVPKSMPALQRAHVLSAKAARVGFDWPDLLSVRQKITEELNELDEAIASNNMDAISHEMGDVFLALVNWTRKLKLDSEQLIRDANARFESRFHYIESVLQKQGLTPAQSNLADMERLWQEAKQHHD